MADISEKEWFLGWSLYSQLLEQANPVRMGDAYLWKEQIMTQVQGVINELAPDGVNSQGEYLAILDKALNQVDQDMRSQAQDEGMMADIELTLSMIERTMRMIPFQVFFSHAKGI
ncbi:MAG: hypothetical protein WC761_02160 [Candidatus Paceibacterota bacterium]|jgi:small-conductance mechanosensitive channel